LLVYQKRIVVTLPFIIAKKMTTFSPENATFHAENDPKSAPFHAENGPKSAPFHAGMVLVRVLSLPMVSSRFSSSRAKPLRSPVRIRIHIIVIVIVVITIGIIVIVIIIIIIYNSELLWWQRSQRES
jgi:hypothetical protein